MTRRQLLEVGAFALFLLAFAISLGAFPLPWQDEVHIVEMGRAYLGDGPSPSAFAIAKNGANFCPFYFLGPVVQEGFYRLLGAYGPRISSMLGLIAFALLCRRWTKLRWRDESLSALAFWMTLLNALLVHSARLVRVDTWAFALLFMALVLLRSETAVRSARTRFALAGLLTGINLFVWPSTFLFAFFLLLECLSLWAGERASARTRLVDVCCAAGGALLGSGLCLPLIPSGIRETLSGYYAGTGGGPVTCLDPFRVIVTSAIVWSKEILRDPAFLALAALGSVVLLRRRRFAEITLAGLCFCAMIPSGLHTYRFVYLWPFLILFALEGLRALRTRAPRFFVVAALLWLSGAAVTGSLAYAAVALICPRPGADVVTRHLADAVGRNAEQSVYSLSFQTYFAGRSLGWTYYRYADNADVFAPAATKLLDRVNTVLIPAEPDYYAAEESFTPFGLLRNAVIRCARLDAASGTESPAGRLGASLAFRATKGDVLSAFERRLEERGFRKASVVSFEEWRARVPAWFAPLEPFVQSVRGYDDLVVWRKK